MENKSNPVCITIIDQGNGNICSIPIPKTGKKYALKLKQSKTRLKKALPLLTGISITADGRYESGNLYIFQKAESEIYKAFDRLYGKGTAEQLFTATRPFASIKTGFYCTELFKRIDLEVMKKSQERSCMNGKKG